MKQEILNKLGSDHTDPAFIDNLGVAIYTYKNEVYVLQDGMDRPLEAISEDLQLEIAIAINDGFYEVDPTYQG